jgi:hypothetical protein
LETSGVSAGRGNGIAISGATDVRVENCTIFGLGQDGMTLYAQDSAVVNSSISDCGCKGLTTSGGIPSELKPGAENFLFEPFLPKVINLPRQARDKHRKGL